MKILTLTADNLDKLVEFEIQARATEGDVFLDKFDSESYTQRILSALSNPHYASATCMMCEDSGSDVIGRIDFALLPSFAFGGELRAYIDWLYVLKTHRHKGAARFLLDSVVSHLRKLGVSDYFLITADNPDAQRFYRKLEHTEISRHDILTGGIYDTNG